MLKEILSSETRAEIFRILFGLSERELHVREIQRRAGFGVHAVRQELQKLEDLDLVSARRDGNRLYFRANRGHPLFPEIHRLVLKTIGLTDVLREALKDLPIRCAFVFGSIASGEAKAESDVDLFVVGDVTLRKLARPLAGASEILEREVNPVILKPAEFERRRQRGEHFLSHVLDSPRLFIIGTEDDLKAVGSKPMASSP